MTSWYGGVRFRSRVEARWAATFDLLGWRWSYEPVDLAGYQPDFALHFSSPVLVEVKGYLDEERVIDECRKLRESEWRGLTMVLGAVPDMIWLSLKDPAELTYCPRGVRRLNGHWSPVWDFNSDSGRLCFRDECDGRYDRDENTDMAELDRLFREAGNATQWRPR